jgi:hypothetical protein
MPCQVSEQSVVAKSWPLTQGSGVLGSVLGSTAAPWANPSVDEKQRTAAAIKFVVRTESGPAAPIRLKQERRVE